jgi:hypothetical protein
VVVVVVVVVVAVVVELTMVFGGGSEGGGGSGHRGLFSSACGSSSFVFGLIYFLSSSPCDRGVTGEPSSCYVRMAAARGPWLSQGRVD